MESIRFSEGRFLDRAPVLELFGACGLSGACERGKVMEALAGSHALVTAWDAERLVGLGNSLSDGHLVVYYPHLLVSPAYRGRGIGSAIMRRLMRRYAGLRRQVIVAEEGASDFYAKLGFERASASEPMLISI